MHTQAKAGMLEVQCGALTLTGIKPGWRTDGKPSLTAPSTPLHHPHSSSHPLSWTGQSDILTSYCFWFKHPFGGFCMFFLLQITTVSFRLISSFLPFLTDLYTNQPIKLLFCITPLSSKCLELKQGTCLSPHTLKVVPAFLHILKHTVPFPSKCFQVWYLVFCTFLHMSDLVESVVLHIP